MKHRSKTHALLVIATSVTVSWLASAAEAQSHRTHRAGAHRSNGHRASAVSRPAPHRTAPRQAQQRRLASPGGLSAANVRPGFYRQLDVPRHPGGHGGAVPVPVYIYPTYYPEPYYPAAPAAAAPAPREAPAPAVPPIYIVQPPVIAAPPAVAAPAAAPAPPAPPTPRSTEPGEVKISVLPEDARVYLDDDYLGTGAELAALDEAPLLPPGVHVLAVTHPDYRSQRLVFGVNHRDPAHVLIDLSIEKIGRRTRIK